MLHEFTDINDGQNTEQDESSQVHNECEMEVEDIQINKEIQVIIEVNTPKKKRSVTYKATPDKETQDGKVRRPKKRRLTFTPTPDKGKLQNEEKAKKAKLRKEVRSCPKLNVIS